MSVCVCVCALRNLPALVKQRMRAPGPAAAATAGCSVADTARRFEAAKQ